MPLKASHAPTIRGYRDSGVSSRQTGRALWTQLSFARMTLMLLYHLLTIHALCHAPFFGLVAVGLGMGAPCRIGVGGLPPLVIGVLERMVFGTSHFTNLVSDRLSGGRTEALTPPGTMPMDPMAHATLGAFLMSPGLWIGLALTGVFLAASIRLRHCRGPMS